jgi:phosphatidylglycerol:prolipoprotein diacylglycerol transferase
MDASEPRGVSPRREFTGLRPRADAARLGRIRHLRSPWARASPHRRNRTAVVQQQRMSMLAAYLHTFDPFAVEFGGGFGIRWYGLSYLLGFLLGYLLVRRVTQVGVSSVAPQRVADLIITLAIGIVVGGRLGYVLFYRIDLLWTFTASPPWWSALAINEGGMASHGGMIGGIVASGWFAWRHGHRWSHLLDLFAFGAPLGLFFGRIANFINGELLGRPCDPALPWAVKFPQELWQNPQVAQLATDALARAGITTDGYGTIAWIVAELQQRNRDVTAVVEPLLTPLHPSQLYAAVGEGLIVFAVLAVAWMRPRKPFLIGSLFCITYATMRIVDELFREPDEHLGLQALGLTRGQWLSVGLLALGMVGMVLWRRSTAPPMGGWLRSTATPHASG